MLGSLIWSTVEHFFFKHYQLVHLEILSTLEAVYTKVKIDNAWWLCDSKGSEIYSFHRLRLGEVVKNFCLQLYCTWSWNGGGEGEKIRYTLVIVWKRYEGTGEWIKDSRTLVIHQWISVTRIYELSEKDKKKVLWKKGAIYQKSWVGKVRKIKHQLWIQVRSKKKKTGDWNKKKEE